MTVHRLTIALATAAALLGAGHIALTPLLYPGWTINALWFVGTGLAMMIGAAANILALASAGRVSRSVIIVVDLTMTAFFGSAWPLLSEPQVIVGGVLFAGLAVCTVISSMWPVRLNSST